MVFLRSFTVPDLPQVIPAGTLHLRVPQVADFVQWAELRQQSREFLSPWEPIWPRDDLTRSAFRRRVRRYHQDMREDTGYAFFICRNSDDALLGGVTLGNVRRGVTQSCSVGYWTGKPYAHRGVMSRAIAGIVPFVFDQLRLNRLEAACLPHNEASIRVLEKAGFQREGLARKYLCINGMWQDHLLYALLHGDPRAGAEEPEFANEEAAGA